MATARVRAAGAAGAGGGARAAARRRAPQGVDRGDGREQPRLPSRGPVDDVSAGEPVEVAGYLDLRDEGYGFLRVNGYLPSRDDVYVSVKQTRQYGLRKGDHVTGLSRLAGRNEKNPALLRSSTDGQRRRSGAGPTAPPVRGPHAAVPGREAAPGGPGRLRRT